MTTDNPYNVASIFDIVRAVSLEGIKYAKDSYDIDRYNQLLELTKDGYSQMFSYDKKILDSIFDKSIGCITPKCGADAAVLNLKNEILILKRSDDKSWCLPCGWVNVGESFSEAAVRETKEETGIECVPEFYIDISKKGPKNGTGILNQINIIILMKRVTNIDSRICLSHEHEEYKWISNITEVDYWHPGHRKQVEKIINYLNSNVKNHLNV